MKGAGCDEAYAATWGLQVESGQGAKDEPVRRRRRVAAGACRERKSDGCLGSNSPTTVIVLSRRRFLSLLPLVVLARPARALSVRQPGHPTPRPGITAARVLPDARLSDKSAAPVYAMVREIPQVVDGIRCHCGCAGLDGFYSLLTCYEQGGMAQHCVICQGQARLAYRLHTEGFSLNGIRKAIDAQFGD
jgi:hypothetical protein